MQQLALARALPPASPRVDPIAHAVEALRSAVLVPFEAARAASWAKRFELCAATARRALVEHILRAERAASEVNVLAAARPHLVPLIGRQAGEHSDLLRRCHSLVEDTLALAEPGIWDMVELAERAKALGRDVARHHERLLQIVHEADYRELGGEAG